MAAGSVVGSMVSQPANARELRSNQNGGRLVRTSASVLTFSRYFGEVLEIRDEMAAIPAGGIALNVTTTNTIDVDGNDSAIPTAASTLYYVCLSNSISATPLALRLYDAAGPIISSTTSGQRYLNSTGDGQYWRIIGQVYTTAAGGLVDTPARRLVMNYENQLPLSLLATPGFTDNNAQTTIAPANVTYAAMNAGTGDLVEFISDGYAAVYLHLEVVVVAGPAAGVSQYGIGIDTVATAVCACQVAAAAVNVCGSTTRCAILSAGYHAANMICATGLGATLACDLVRAGGTADPIGTQLTGWVLS